MKATLTHILLATFSAILAVILAEFVLAALSFESAHRRSEPGAVNVPRELCSASSLDDLIAKGKALGAFGGLNLKRDQDLGYTWDRQPHGLERESKQFSKDYGNYKRVLVLGDSFTAGCCAEPGNSYVELLNQYFKKDNVLFFNTAVSGYGTNNQLAMLRKYYQVIEPDAVLLGFYTGNDFDDNLTPLDRWTKLPGQLFVGNYEVITADDNVHARRRSRNEILRIYKESAGCDETSSNSSRNLKEFVRDEILYRTRIGTLIYYQIYDVMEGLGSRPDPGRGTEHRAIQKRGGENQGIAVTETYLLEIKRYLEKRHVPFYGLLIPDRWESVSAGRLVRSRDYLAAVRMFKRLGIQYFDPFDELTLEDYVLTKNNDHWNNSGHFKAFELVRKKLAPKLNGSMGEMFPRRG